MQLPASKRLAWLQAKDCAEWVSKFRESTLTLGQVIKETYETRDAHWVVTLSQDAQPHPAIPLPQPVASLQSQFQLGQKVNGKLVAKTMRDGKELCPAFQQGNCKTKGSSCPKGAHRCGVHLQLCEPWSFHLRCQDQALRVPRRRTFEPGLSVLWMAYCSCRLGVGFESRFVGCHFSNQLATSDCPV